MAQTAISSSDNTVRVLSHLVEIAWDGSAWVDESAYVVSLDGGAEVTRPTKGMATPGGRASAHCTVVLNNMRRGSAGRFSPSNTAGPLYSLLNRTDNPQNAGGYFRPIRVSLGFGGELRRVFTGVIVNPDERWVDRTVVLSCQDHWTPLARRRPSTILYRNQRVDQLIGYWLTASGLGYSSSLETSPRIVDWAWLAEDSVAEDLQRLMEADGGMGYFRYDGVFIYRDPTWPARATSSVYTFTTAKFEALEPEWSFDEMFGQVVVQIQTRYVAQQSVIWEGADDISVGPGETKTLTAHFADPVLASSIATPVYSESEADSDWVAVNAANMIMEVDEAGVTLTGTVSKSNLTTTVAGLGTKFLSEVRIGDRVTIPGTANETRTVTLVASDTSLSVQAVFLNAASGQTATRVRTGSAVAVTVTGTPNAQSATVTLVNNTTTEQRAYLTKLQVRGQPVVAGKVGRAVVGSDGQVHSVDNLYIQSTAHGEAISNGLSQRFTPVRQTVQLSNPAQPHLEVCDLVTVRETDTGIDRDFFIGRIGYEYGPGFYRMDLDLIDASDFTTYPAYFVVGTSALGGSAVSGASRLWY